MEPMDNPYLQELRTANDRFQKAALSLLLRPSSARLMALARRRYDALCSLAPSLTIRSELGFKKTLHALTALIPQEKEKLATEILNLGFLKPWHQKRWKQQVRRVAGLQTHGIPIRPTPEIQLSRQIIDTKRRLSIARSLANLMPQSTRRERLLRVLDTARESSIQPMLMAPVKLHEWTGRETTLVSTLLADGYSLRRALMMLPPDPKKKKAIRTAPISNPRTP